ncbi:MAG: glycosyltransferase [Bacteroidales bacterium]|nr:glycosyltransferase [Bacteroidales bacterium]
MQLFVAIPALNELDYLPKTLQALEKQKTKVSFSVYICVNQPDSWWEQADKKDICDNNKQLLFKLRRRHYAFPLHIIDKSSPGKGWDDKNFGVGWARKTLFDHIMNIADPEDILVSMDADTVFSEHYLNSLAKNFEQHPQQTAVAVPYYHRLTNDEAANRAILRYEIYMRNCLLNLYRIGCPYNFTAIGSAIAVKIKALQKINGITPMKSGEDFYLLQKLRKMSPISNWNDELVYPAARFSDRVFFGTGPAMIKGSQGVWDSYPIYHYNLFDEVKKTYDLINQLYTEDLSTPFIAFLKEQFKTEDLWEPLRQNVKDLAHFRHAFHEKADGLRVLQFLKTEQSKMNIPDEQSLRENWPLICHHSLTVFAQEEFSFDELNTEQLAELREKLFEEEMEKRRPSKSM